VIEYIPYILIVGCYLAWGVFTHRILCKLVWLSDKSTPSQCDDVEKIPAKFFVIIFWPVMIAIMGD
jgi:hypothetical protein